MLSYHGYQILHLVSAFLLMHILWRGATISHWRKGRVISLISILLLLIFSGVGLMARIGIQYNDTWPLWVLIKLGLVFLLILLIPLWRWKFQKHSAKMLSLFLAIILSACVVAIVRPL